MKTLLIAFALISAGAAAQTTLVGRGPAPTVKVTRDYNLYDIYVKAPTKSTTYTPGSISVYLGRDAPNFMRVPLAAEVLADGRLHVRINIEPATESSYSVFVYDQAPNRGKQLLLLSKKLSGFIQGAK
jgi:hypothetical protein